jgi:predicted membrane channel-forming protein YqfA (hemolysin III family)
MTGCNFFLMNSGTLPIPNDCRVQNGAGHTEETMNGLIYLVGLIVVILAVLSFFGLR